MGDVLLTALTIVGAVLSLVLLEGLLSADNALVLAVMVRHLPKGQQKRALRYGIWGAFIFRAIAVIFATYLLQFWQLKALGGLYLLYLAASHLIFGEGEHEDGKPRRPGSGFWMTVVHVELADIAFSVDSILAAVATAEGLPANLQANRLLTLAIIYAGGVLGIIAMRLVAGVFLVLLERFKGLASGAYVLVAWIGLKLLAGGLNTALHPELIDKRFVPGPGDWRLRLPDAIRGLHIDLPDAVFWAGMALIFIGSMLYRPNGDRGPTADEEPEPAEPVADADRHRP
jgi:YkoY family integral membrane protein